MLNAFMKSETARGLVFFLCEMSRWEVMIEELHHEIKAAQSEAFAIKSNIDAMVGWNPNDASNSDDNAGDFTYDYRGSGQ